MPPAENYGEFDMFEDGVGIVRSFVDDWERACSDGLDAQAARALRAAGARVRYIAGYATRGFMARLMRESAAAEVLSPLFVKNEFFGGNVDVTGLLCGCDIAGAIRAEIAAAMSAGAPGNLLFAVPRVIFNDDGVTLDDMTIADIEKAAGARVAVVSCNGSEFLPEIARLAPETRA